MVLDMVHDEQAGFVLYLDGQLMTSVFLTHCSR